VQTLAARAFRRPATAADVDSLMTFYRLTPRKGLRARHRDGPRTRAGLAAIHLSHRRGAGERGRGQTYRTSDIDLASRLSFFLWSSPPDDALLKVAEQGRLKEPAVLEQQVRRMLAHPKAKALSANFAGSG
jgi:hypothetical protein